MSGLTGYLLADGTDLSSVFMPIEGGGVSLSANNIFTGTNKFSQPLNTSAGIIAPTASLTYTSNMIGYCKEWSSSSDYPTTFTNNTSTLTTSSQLTTGVWLVSGAQLITRLNGTFGITSYTYMVCDLTTGTTGTYTGVSIYQPIPNGYTGEYVFSPMTTGIFVITSATGTLNVSSTTSMTNVSNATRYNRLIFTRIA